MAKEINPRLVFDRLFGAPAARRLAGRAARARASTSKSILDFVLEDARQLRDQLGINDRRKLDEYLDRRPRDRAADRAGRDGDGRRPPGAGVARPAGHPARLPRAHPADVRPDGPRLPGRRDPDQHLHVRQRGEQPRYPFIGVPDGHHDLSHHGDDPEKHEKIKAINRFHIEQFAYLLGKLKSIREGDGHAARSRR